MSSTIPYTFTTTKYVDLSSGSDANNGNTLATAYRTLAKARLEGYYNVGVVAGGGSVTADVSLLIVVAGQSGNKAYGASDSNGFDQVYIDCFADGRTASTGKTYIGVRAAIEEVDGARAGGALYTRPLLSANTVFATLNVSSGAVYKSDISAIIPGVTAGMTAQSVGQVLWRANNAGNFDTDGALKGHLLFTRGAGGGGDAAGNAACASANTAYYNTDTKVLYVNTTGLSTTASDFSWAPSQGIDAFSKVVLSGVDIAACEGFNVAYGDRGVVVFDARQTYMSRVNVYEAEVHGLMNSHSQWAIQNIVYNDCVVQGLGKNSTGDSMFATTGSSGNFNSSNVQLNRCTAVRYMLQNPSGARYTAADYRIIPFSAGTSSAINCGYLLPGGWVATDCVMTDVSATKTYDTYASLFTPSRHTVPTDRTQLSQYAMVFRRLTAYILGGCYHIPTGAEEKGTSVAFDNCKVYQDANGYDMAVDRGRRTTFQWQVQNAEGFWIGFFNGSEWVSDIFSSNAGTPESGQSYSAFGYYTDTASPGNLIKFTKIGSSIILVGNSNNTHYVYDQNSTSDAAQKALDLYCANGTNAVVFPPSYPPANGALVFQDAPASGNTARVFTNETYFGISTYSTANATYANWIANVDPTGQIGTVTPLDSVGVFGAFGGNGLVARRRILPIPC